MKRLAVIVLSAIAGFVLFAFAGYWLLPLLSANSHDGSVEASMTAVFVIGPLGAVACALLGAWWCWPRRGVREG